MGLATGQTVTGTATPLGSIAANDGTPAWTRFDAVINTWRPDCLVVGLPLNMDGTESDMSRRARRFAQRLRQRYSVRVAMADERLTTREARSIAPDADDHALAACLIAEGWLGDHPATGE